MAEEEKLIKALSVKEFAVDPSDPDTRKDQLKNLDEQKVSNGQVLMDLLIKSAQIALDHIHQTSVEQLVENVMGATKSDIIFGCAQTTRKVGLISLTTTIPQEFL